MTDIYASFIGKWVNIKCKSFTGTGTIEMVTKNWILLSNAEYSDCKITSKHKGIDVNLIETIEYIEQPQNSINNTDKSESIKPKPTAMNVFTSETQPPVIKRGGSSSAVDRNFNRQNSFELNQRYNSPSIGNTIPVLDNRMHFSGRFSPDVSHQTKNVSSRRNGGGNGNRSVEPAWMSFTPSEPNGEFDFDGNLALFDKQAICGTGTGHNNWHKKQRNESSDSSDYSTAAVIGNRFVNKSAASGRGGGGGGRNNRDNHHRKYNRSHTFSFNSDDFLYPADAPTNATGSSNHTRPTSNIYDQLTQWHELYMPQSGTVNHATQHQQHQQQPPDLVREITQQQMKKTVLTRLKKTSVISIINSSKIFHHFNEFWNLDDDGQFPVFTVKQRDCLFDTASQLGIQSYDICNIVGETLSDFIITQVGGFSRINNTNIKEIPKIAILLGRCSASVYVSYVAKDLLKKGCHILVFVDDNSNSGNIQISYEIQTIKTLLSKSDSVLGYNLLTYNIKDLSDKRFDYVISGVESDSFTNNPNDHLKIWCSNQSSQILCVNPPKISQLLWKSAVFIGVPTFSHDDFSIVDPIPKVCKNRPSQLRKSHRKPDGLILLCNVKFPRKVFSFLKLDYHCPFSSKNWIRLYNDNDLCLVE